MGFLRGYNYRTQCVLFICELFRDRLDVVAVLPSDRSLRKSSFYDFANEDQVFQQHLLHEARWPKRTTDSWPSSSSELQSPDSSSPPITNLVSGSDGHEMCTSNATALDIRNRESIGISRNVRLGTASIGPIRLDPSAVKHKSHL